MRTRVATANPAPAQLALEEGREALRTRNWGMAFLRLSAADREAELQCEDLVELAQAALLTGRETEGAEYLSRAHQGFVRRGDVQPAARCAFWLGFTSLLNGEAAKAGGWLSRAERLLQDSAPCVESGYLLLPRGLRLFRSGEADTAYAMFVQATEIGEKFADRDLIALGLQGQGRALIRQGQVARGLDLLDEAMVAVMADEISPLNAGGVYCSVLDACGEILDLQRAHEWTSALEKWCESQPDLVPFRGHCLIRRSELQQLHGAWDEALTEAQRASDYFSRPSQRPAVAAALYQIGEIQRLRGNLEEAREAYQRAALWQPNPGPGLALLQLAQGQAEAAYATIQRLAEEIREPAARRARVLDAFVEISLAAREVDRARAAAKELAEMATQLALPFFVALSARTLGAVLLAEGDARAALGELRRALNLWSELQAPYESARVRCAIAQACQALGDDRNARMELTIARQTFEQLGAGNDLRCLEKAKSQNPTPLTSRELEVLRLIASGVTNRAIGRKLSISEKTVARHVSNIFMKLNLYSRSAAVAYAYEHGLV